jgi:hypothetical protein
MGVKYVNPFGFGSDGGAIGQGLNVGGFELDGVGRVNAGRRDPGELGLGKARQSRAEGRQNYDAKPLILNHLYHPGDGRREAANAAKAEPRWLEYVSLA